MGLEGGGAPGTARTCNPQIRSLVLYPLSYGRLACGLKGLSTQAGE
jgi:hypothetical protein